MAHIKRFETILFSHIILFCNIFSKKSNLLPIAIYRYIYILYIKCLFFCKISSCIHVLFMVLIRNNEVNRLSGRFNLLNVFFIVESAIVKNKNII